MQNVHQNELAGEFMIQDRDHMVDSNQLTGKAKRGNRQVEQGQTGDRQQGGSDQAANRQQGGDQGRRRH